MHTGLVLEIVDPRRARTAYTTAPGALIYGPIEGALETDSLIDLQGRVDLLLTSSPFPLTTKKEYGNGSGQDYLDWLSGLAPRFASLLAPTGSMVIEIGNAWQKGHPVMSALLLEALLCIKAARISTCASSS
jgi:site-specific DNA-methyltransferase (cytosine-N4-specific)